MNFTSAKQNACLLLLATLCLSACEAPAGQEWKPTIGLSTTIENSYDLDISGLGYSLSVPMDYSSNEFELGATLVTPDHDGRTKHLFAGIKYGSGDIKEPFGTSQDLEEASLGGILYFDKGTTLVPFFSIWAVSTEYPDQPISEQLGIRPGVGVEYVISENAALTIGADYLIPLDPGEDEVGVDGELSGLAVRLGIRFVL